MAEPTEADTKRAREWWSALQMRVNLWDRERFLTAVASLLARAQEQGR